MKMLLRLHLKQLSNIHKDCINNNSTVLSDLEDQIRDAEYTLDCLRLDCYNLSYFNIDPALLNNYFESAELMFMEIYSHNMIRIRNLCS